MMISRAPKMWALAALAGVLAACGGSDNPVCSPTDPGCDPGDGNGNGTTSTPLVVSQVSPTNGSSSVATDTEVTITFSRPVAAASVTPTSVTVGSVAGTRATDGASVTFTPEAPFAEGTSYTVTINGVTDADGVGLEGNFTSSFTTLSSPLAANAGPDMNVTAGSQAMLDGSASTGTGANYTWAQLAGPTVGTLTGQTPTFNAPAEISKLTFELSVSGSSGSEMDTVHVWVLEDADHALWVSPSGSDSNPGTREAPMATLEAAIEAADGAGNGADIYLAGGEYAESVTLRSRVSLYGGWDESDGWSRDVVGNPAVVRGGSMAVRGNEANNLVIEGLEVVAADATEVSESSIAILLNNSTGVVVRRSAIFAGLGRSGANGAGGVNGAAGGNGAKGMTGGLCTTTRTGGSGGTSPGGQTGGRGGNGGFYGGLSGSDGVGGGGAGGGGGTVGSPGGAPREGDRGHGGTTFSLNGEGFVAAPGSLGLGGGHGSGGGGGGGGGGNGIGGCGGGGGGGGGGGSAGTGGMGGGGGGASIGIALVGLSAVEIRDLSITTAGAGNGGNGGRGGTGGAQGNRGDGGDSAFGVFGGARGGHGSRGGHGGGGGGGVGGSSFGILEDVDASSTRSGNTFALGPAGSAGAGGASSGDSGTAGAAGEQAEHRKMTP